MPSFTVPQDRLDKPSFDGAGAPPDGNYTAIVSGIEVVGNNRNWTAVQINLDNFLTPEGAATVQNGEGAVDLSTVQRRFTVTAEIDNPKSLEIAGEQFAKTLAAFGLLDTSGDATVSWEDADDMLDQLQPGVGARVGLYMKRKPSKKDPSKKYQEVTSVYPLEA